MTEPPGPQLNEHQRRRILATCQYIDKLLTDLDTSMAAASSRSPFGRYLDDLTPAQKQLLSEAAANMREQMMQVLRSQDVVPVAATVSLQHTVRTSLGFVDIALEELRPQHMRGYGDLPAALEPQLNGLASELQSLVQRIDAALTPNGAAVLPQQVARPGQVNESVTETIDTEQIEADMRKIADAVNDVRAICERLREPRAAIVFEALDLAAERASKALDWPDDAPAGLDDVIRGAVTKVGSERTEDIRLAFANLAARARTTFEAAARALGLSEPAVGGSWTDVMRDMPQFVAPDLHVELRLFLRRALGSSAAHARVRRAIEAQAGAPIGQALEANAAATYEWATRALALVDQHCESQIRTFRARLLARHHPDVRDGGVQVDNPTVPAPREPPR